MVGLGPNREESMGSQRQDHFFNLEQRRDREVNAHTIHTSRSQSRSGSHVSHEKNTRTMQLEIDRLKRKSHCERRRQTPSNSGLFFFFFFFPMMMGMVVIDPGQGLPPVNISCVMRITTVSIGIKAHLAKAWKTTL